MVASRSCGVLALVACASAGLSGAASAEITYQSAVRSVYASASTSSQRYGSGPATRGTAAYGVFHSGVEAWASGDFYSEAEAWQRSNLAADAIRIEMSAGRSGGGFPLPGWFGSSSQSLVTTQFTLDERTPFWIIMDAADYFGDGAGGAVSITGGVSDVSVSGTGSWEGFLDAGAYTLTASMSASHTFYEGQHFNNVFGGWSTVTLGVPAPATASVLAACGVLAWRRRRS